MGSQASRILLLLAIILLSIPWAARAENIDPGNSGSQYAYGENVGWINLQPSQGPGVTVSSTGLNGYAWGENIGWINLSPSAGGVLNDGSGNLSGYAWGENTGWINFAPADGGVFIDECGDFNGEAWGENIGWISFRSGMPVPFKVSTSWTPPDIFPPTTSAYGPGSGWYNTNVSVSLQAVDNVCGSGVRDIRYALGGSSWVTVPGATASLAITAEGYNILSYLSTDNANNAETAHLMTVKIDKTPPSIILTTPEDTANYFINYSVPAVYGASDSLSGIASITGTVPSGNPINTGSIGTKSFSVTAVDAAGNSATVTASYSVAFPGNIDTDNAGCQYAWAENAGWINFKPLWGPGVTVSNTAVAGKAWGENIGWINLNPSNGGVVNNGQGNLSGYAWGENVGWINFAPAGGGVRIGSDGRFVGYAWGESVGWINFGSLGSCVKTAWAVPNNPPVAVDMTVTTPEDTPLSIALVATDADGDTLTYAIVSNPPHGTLTGTPPNVVYTPALNYNGSDSFTFKANDGKADSNIATVSITVTPLNDVPIVSAGPNATISEGSVFTGSGSFIDPDPDTWTATVDYGDGSGVQPLALTGKTFSLSHLYVENGTYTVTVAVNDGTVTGYGSLTVTVTNAPIIVGLITAPLDPVALGLTVAASAPFSDAGVLDTHTATWDWGDGMTSSGLVTESNGSGSVTGIHVYSLPGVYTITVTVTDDDGGTGMATFEYVVVYDPAGGFVTGGGWIMSPEGAYVAETALTGKATFGFVSKYKKGATVPTGETEFQFKVADLNFKSISYDWLVIAGAKAQYKGSGIINGTGNYGFMLTAIDGAINGGRDADKFRIKIWDKETGQIVYDNMLGATDDANPTTVIGGGSIVIHN